MLIDQQCLNQSIQIFTEILEQNPTDACVYNNRAQAYRCLNMDGDALQDLDKAIELGNAQKQYSVLRQAYTQRAIIRKKKLDSLVCLEQNEHIEIEKNELLKDFQLGAKYGNKIAAYYAVKLNPYAALCNDMLKTIMTAYNR